MNFNIEIDTLPLNSSSFESFKNSVFSKYCLKPNNFYEPILDARIQRISQLVEFENKTHYLYAHIKPNHLFTGEATNKVISKVFQFQSFQRSCK